MRPLLYCGLILFATLIYTAVITAQSGIIVDGHGAITWPLALQNSTDADRLLDNLPDRIIIDRAEVVRHMASEYPVGLLPTPTPTRTPTPTQMPTATTPTVTPTPTTIFHTPTSTSPSTTPTPTTEGVTPQPTTPTPTDTAPSPTPTPTTPSQPGDGDSYEADNECAAAKPITTDGLPQQRTFHDPGDVDWVRFDAIANTSYRVEVTLPDESAVDIKLALYSQCDDRPDDEWDETFTPGARLDFVAPATGAIYVRLQNRDEEVGGVQERYFLSVRTLPAQPETGALIIVAGRLSARDPLQRNIHNVTDRVYRLFQGQGYTNDNIYYIATDDRLVGYDAAATKANLEYAITQWAPQTVSSGKPLTLYLMDHGGQDKFYLDGAAGVIVTPQELDNWLATFEQTVANAKVNVILEACFIGSFIKEPGTISQGNRVVIASSDNDWSAYASPDGAFFSDHFLTALQQGRNLFTSFDEAQRRVNELLGYQNPWLDADGDGIPNEQADFAIAAERGFAYAGTFPDADGDVWPPFIVSAAGPTTITNRRGLLSTEVRDDGGVESVWAVVYAPSYEPPTSDESLLADTAPTLLLTPQGNDRYGVEYPAFDEVGTYRILVYAKDALGNVAQPQVVTVTVGVQIYLPLVTR